MSQFADNAETDFGARAMSQSVRMLPSAPAYLRQPPVFGFDDLQRSVELGVCSRSNRLSRTASRPAQRPGGSLIPRAEIGHRYT